MNKRLLSILLGVVCFAIGSFVGISYCHALNKPTMFVEDLMIADSLINSIYVKCHLGVNINDIVDEINRSDNSLRHKYMIVLKDGVVYLKSKHDKKSNLPVFVVNKLKNYNAPQKSDHGLTGNFL